MKAPLSAFTIVGLLAVVVLLGQHSRMLVQDMDTLRSERDTARTERDTARDHEKDLQAALVTGEKTLRDLTAQHEQAVEGLKNAKPNDCTDAPVAPDIDRILRSATASLGYMPDSRIGAAPARDSGMERNHEQGLGGILLEGPTRCISV